MAGTMADLTPAERERTRQLCELDNRHPPDDITKLFWGAMVLLLVVYPGLVLLHWI